MNPTIVEVDVRADIRSGAEPMAKILRAVAALQPHDHLRLLAPFEPVPLFYMLASQGFSHQARPLASGDWEVLFTKTGSPLPTADRIAGSSDSPRSRTTEIVEVDARGLEPPQPLVKILEAVSVLPTGARLQARTDRRPMHLYPQLDERGFSAETTEQPDGSFLTQIFRR